MKKIYFILFFIITNTFNSLGQYEIEWAKTFGGAGWDEANSVFETKDHSLVIVGYAKRKDKSLWILKVDENSGKIWGRNFVNPKYHSEGECVIQTADNCYVIVGTCYPIGQYHSDLWAIKIDEAGNILWDKKFNRGILDQGGYSVTETSDSGYAITGYRIENNSQKPDVWVLKLNNNGEQLWEQTFGGDKEDEAYSIIETDDKGLAIAGYNGSRGGALRMFWVMKLDADGNWEWDDYFKAENSYWDVAVDLTETHDKGFAVTGYTKTEGMTDFDVRLIKLDNNGTFQWGKNYKNRKDTMRNYWEESTAIVETYDRGFAICGFNKLNNNFDNFWIMKLNSTGEMEWDTIYGGSSFDYPNDIIETYDKGLVVVGCTYNQAASGWDYAVLKLRNTSILPPKIKITNPDSIISIFGKKDFNLEACIISKDTSIKATVWLNDSIIIDSARVVFPAIPDSLCDAYLNEKIELQEGINRIKIEAKNIAGKNSSKLNQIIFNDLLKIKW